MKEHPILFSGPMVRALLAGHKTQTRRLKPQRWKVGDRLWVRETWAVGKCADGLKPSELSPRTWKVDNGGLWLFADRSEPRTPISPRGKTRVSIFMPRWASRITLEVVRVWQEPLHAISEADAEAEGITDSDAIVGQIVNPYRTAYADLWDMINGAGSWADNQTVYATEFRVVKPC